MALKFRKARKTTTRKRRKARKNPAANATVKYRTRTVTKYRTRKAKANPSRKRRRIRRNPSGVKGIKKALPMVLGIGGGVTLGLIANKYIPASVPARFRGALHLIVGAIGASMFKNEWLKNASYGFAGAGVLDLLRANVPMLALGSADELAFLADGTESIPLGADTLQMLGDGTDSIPLGEDDVFSALGEVDYNSL